MYSCAVFPDFSRICLFLLYLPRPTLEYIWIRNANGTGGNTYFGNVYFEKLRLPRNPRIVARLRGILIPTDTLARDH